MWIPSFKSSLELQPDNPEYTRCFAASRSLGKSREGRSIVESTSAVIFFWEHRIGISPDMARSVSDMARRIASLVGMDTSSAASDA